jgi:hypothetical protein
MLLMACNPAVAGSFFGPIVCGPRPPHPSDIAGVYEDASAKSYVRLEVSEGGVAELYEGADERGRSVDRLGRMYILDGAPFGTSLAGGVILVAGWNTADDWPRDEFVFEGFSSRTGERVTRRYKREYNRELDRLEILDVSDPSNPFKLSPPTVRFFPWTESLVVGLVLGGLAALRFATRTAKLTKADTSKPAV